MSKQKQYLFCKNIKNMIPIDKRTGIQNISIIKAWGSGINDTKEKIILT
jgi:hypothetical protein